MNQSTVTLLDLPIEILHIILKKLDNMDVLYSLLGIDNQRLDTIVLDKTFTKSLNFVLRTTTDDLMPIIGSMLDRFCIDILPKIDYNVKSLTLHSESMERILAADFPNLSELRLYNVNNNTISRYFTNESPFRRIIQEQITDLIFLYKYDNRILLKWEYSNDVSDIGFIKLLSLRNLPLTAYSSSTICKLCVHVNRFEDCLALLDGRLKQLTTFIVTIENHDYRTSINYKKDSLPNLKYFSLKCHCTTKKYDTQIVPLIRRISNLKELTLNIQIEHRTRFVDGTQINNEILVHLPQLYKFTFHISTNVTRQHLVQLSNDDIQQTFTNIGYEQVCCYLTYSFDNATCRIFSLPFAFDDLQHIGNIFPPIVFTHVIHLGVYDLVPFEHEFFLRIAHCFPLLKELVVMNFESQSHISNNLNSNDNQMHSIAEYHHLTSLSVRYCHIDYVEQFLNETKTHLPRLTELIVDYNQLTIVTENFTRNTTRLNCAKVKQLIIIKALAHSKDLYDYFPVLSSCFCSE
ncbi:unnamed protein product [Rotaria sp. Silwood2]|nr:unnamed protein product [Rotaria sp. Silwood2]